MKKENLASIPTGQLGVYRFETENKIVRYFRRLALAFLGKTIATNDFPKGAKLGSGSKPVTLA